MSPNPIARKMQHMVSACFEACRKQDASAIAACFAPGAVHYFPTRQPLLGGSAIGTFIVDDLRNRGGEYFFDRIFTDVEQSTAAVEWSRTFNESDRILRGFAFYQFDTELTLIRRAYFAAAPDLNKHQMRASISTEWSDSRADPPADARCIQRDRQRLLLQPEKRLVEADL